MNNSHIIKHIDYLCNDDVHEEDYVFSMGRLQTLLELGSLEAECTLYSRAINSSYDFGARGRMLEALSGARVPSIALLVYSAISVFLKSDDHDILFAAIACATNLPRRHQIGLMPAVMKYCEDQSHLGRAARCFCEVGEFLKKEA